MAQQAFADTLKGVWFVLRVCEERTLSDGHVETGNGVRAQEKVSGAN